MDIVKGVGRLFYIINPNETYVETVTDLPHPDYVNQAVPYFVTFIILEYLIQWWRGKPVARINDGITSMSHGIFIVCGIQLTRGLESFAYIKIYENYRILELPWDSPWTWYIAAIGVDFGYYWIHRCGHELNVLWAQHQVHHSSEDYNLTTALRQSGLQAFVVWVFYLPLALFVPPSIFLIHAQFNLIYQFWIHTEVIDSLGPLEYIFNTPKHHRLHHGSNRYALDKNYAGFLIIWDRMFGTFESERPGEKLVYGLVEEVDSMNPFWLQIFYIPKLWARTNGLPSIKDKFRVWLNGPGWSPGKPRLGDPMDCPEIPNKRKFDPQIPAWQSAYAVFQFFVTLIIFDHMSKNIFTLNQMTVTAVVAYVIYSLTSIGLVIEGRMAGVYSELARCLFTLLILSYSHMSPSPLVTHAFHAVFTVSAGIWAGVILLGKSLPINSQKKLT